MNKRPNFFIVGAPKTGTTSLAEYLSLHPQIFFSTPKEPNYFGKNLPDRIRRARDEEEYLHLFDKALPEHCRIGEASTWYLYSRQALLEIKAFDSTAKIIVMLRNPIELIPSLHSQLVFSMNDHTQDFKKSWDMNKERQTRCKNLDNANEYILCYDQVGKLGQQLAYAYEVFDKTQVMYVFLEDIKSNPDHTYNEVLRFLEVQPHSLSSYKQHNPNKIHRFYWLGRLLTVHNTKPHAGWRKIKSSLGIPSFQLATKFTKKINMKYTQREPIGPEIYSMLLKEFREDIDLLEQLTGRDLAHWKKQPVSLTSHE